MQVVTPQARHQAGLTLSLAIGVTGSPQALSRLKAKLELAVEDALQDLSQQASNELGIEIGVVSRKPRNFRQPINMACLALGR